MSELVFFTFSDGTVSEHARRPYTNSYGVNTKSIPGGLLYIDTKSGSVDTLQNWQVARLGNTFIYHVYNNTGESLLVRINTKQGKITTVSKSEVDMYNAGLATGCSVLTETGRDSLVDEFLENGYIGLINKITKAINSNRIRISKVQVAQPVILPSLEEAI